MPVPDMSAQADSLIAWLSENGVALLIITIVLLLAYRWARPAIHRVLTGLLQAQSKTLGTDAVAVADVEKRVSTIEDLLVKVLKAAVVLTIFVVILGVFDLWSVLAGLGIVIAAITLAGQNIVLDYLMGILILVEGQYYKGDIVRINAVEGTVEEVGLRRTLIRDVRGTLHSLSNGDVRTSANLTRTYAVAMVTVDGVPDHALEAAIGVLEQVGRDLAMDPALEGVFLDTPGYTGTTALTAAGATIRISGRVIPEQRMRVEVEMRRRVAAGLAAAGIELIHPMSGPGSRS
jgi:small-conductance mechanosensitive channel